MTYSCEEVIHETFDAFRPDEIFAGQSWEWQTKVVKKHPPRIGPNSLEKFGSLSLESHERNKAASGRGGGGGGDLFRSASDFRDQTAPKKVVLFGGRNSLICATAAG